MRQGRLNVATWGSVNGRFGSGFRAPALICSRTVVDTIVRIKVAVDVFTWRDRGIPDNAPPQILAIWKDMTRLTGDRNGRPGLKVEEATRIDR